MSLHQVSWMLSPFLEKDAGYTYPESNLIKQLNKNDCVLVGT
jgi:hypothetical protein